MPGGIAVGCVGLFILCSFQGDHNTAIAYALAALGWGYIALTKDE